MFRWLKDRGRKGRKPSTDSKLSLEGVRSKEDDYGFKQKQQGGGGVGEYKRDLPPTPADLMTSCSVTDDDKSFHIYEEIPDLPFRCTPEGELRFTLAKEEASRRRRRGSSRAGSPHSAASLPGSQGPRNISPYMVVPLERLGGTPSEFRGHNDSSEFRGHNDSSEFRGHNDSSEFRAHNDSSEFRAHNDSSEFRARTDASEFRGPNDSSEIRGSRDGSSFACALVGRKMPDGYPESGAVTAASPGCESASQGTSTPSCCGSSVFGSPLEVAGRCGCAGGDGVDMSDRLLSAINLTRLLAAVRLSSSSADTCTTSPICIGVDKDGRNISVSVSVTPTTPTNNNNNNNNLNHNEDNNGDDDDQKTAGESASSKTETGSADPQDHFVSEAETGSTSTREPGSNSSSSSSPPETGSTSTHGAKTGFVAKSEAGLTPINNDSNDSSTNGNKGQSGMSSVQPTTQTGLRFLPSPLEQTALSEILQLRPGESTELDPATIDAIILRLCSHTLQVEGQGQGHGQDDGRASSSAATAGLSKPRSSSSLQRQELEDVERMLKEMVRAGEDDVVVVSGGGGGVRGRASAKHHHHNHRHKQSPAARRAENSDTGFEYDVSTSSESDHTNYDYFLSKVARTRSLECEVKKMLRSSDSSRCESDYDDDDGEEEEEEEEEEREEKEKEGVSGARESVSSSSSTTTGSSTISQTSQTRRKRERLTPEVDAATDSDDGTMADLSESENSSGYYESAPGKPVEPFPATSAVPASASASAAARAKSRSGKSASSGKKKAGRGEETGGDVEVQCYELDCSGGEAERGDFFPATGAGYSSSSGSIATATAAAAPACSPSQSRRATAAAPDGLSGVTAEGSSSRPPHHPKTGKGRCSGGCKKLHHKHQHHHHHHHHHRSSSDVNGGRERKRGEIGKSAKKPSGVGGEDGSGGGGSLDASGSSHARSLSLCDRGAGTRTRDCRRGSADAVGADSPNLSRPKSDKDDSNNKKGSNTNTKRSKDATYAKTALKPTDYPYSLLYPTPTPAPNPTSSNGANHSRSHPKTSKGSKKAAARGNAGLERAASFHSEQSPAESVYESRRQASEVYSIPAALPDPSPTPGGGGGGVRGLKGSASVPSKLSVARQVPESSEVYGTRAGLRRCSNRLLSDLIMLNYNRQVLNM